MFSLPVNPNSTDINLKFSVDDLSNQLINKNDALALRDYLLGKKD
ncbi:MAG: hypothetical protein R2771_08475 [Saprospiraceae bacterium]